MITISIIGQAVPKFENLQNSPYLEKWGEDILRALAECSFSTGDTFADYFYKEVSAALPGVTGGELEFLYRDEKLFAVTTYESLTWLNNEQLAILAKYTQGQWADGIGESFEQEPCLCTDHGDYFISPWFYGQKLVVEQLERIKLD